MKPYAVYLLERFKAGETPEELARAEGIPLDRIKMRLTAAAEFAFRIIFSAVPLALSRLGGLPDSQARQALALARTAASG